MPLRHPAAAALLATALCGLAGCGGSKPPAGTGDTPQEGADLRVAEGAHIVVPVGTRVGLGEEETAPRAWRQQRGPAMALAGRDFEPGEVSRRRRAERGPNREPVNVELPRSEAVQAESSVESLGDALEPLEARYLTQCR